MGLNIQQSSFGYDTVGLQNLIKEIKINVIPDVITTLRTKKDDVRTVINSVWVGASAEAFKDKLEYDSDVICNALKSFTYELEANINVVGTNVEELDEEVAKLFGGTGSSGGTSFTSFSSFDNLLSDAKASTKVVTASSVIDKVGGFLSSTGATVATAAFGLVEGVETFGEAILDTGAILGTEVASLFTGAYDLFTGSDSTKQMWDATKGFVSKKLVKDMADDLYANTGVGRWIKDNAYGFDITRGISSGLGYAGGVVALTVATAGIGGAVAGGTASASTATTITAGQLATTAGVAGFGKGTQDAWADGAGTLQGLGYGTLNGAWEAAQFYAGAKIAGFEGFSSSGANVAARIGMDTADSAVESFVQPGLQMIYKDKSYSELFNEGGGWSGVATNAAMGAIGSAIGERSALRDLLGNSNNTYLYNNGTLLLAGGDGLLSVGNNINTGSGSSLGFLSPLAKLFGNSGTKQPKSPLVQYNLTQEGINVRNNLVDALSMDSKNNTWVNNLYGNFFMNEVSGKNTNAMAIANVLTKLADEGRLKTGVSQNIRTSCFDSSNGVLFISPISNQPGVLTHEAGHALFDLIDGGNIKNPVYFESQLNYARVNALNNKDFASYAKNLSKVTCSKESAKYANIETDRYIMNTYHQTRSQYYNSLVNSYNEGLKNGTIDIVNDLRSKGLNDATIASLGHFDANKYANSVINDLISANSSKYVYTNYGNTAAMSDICDAVFLGKLTSGGIVDASNRRVSVGFGHGDQYFSQGDKIVYHEIIANYNQLKTCHGDYQINQLRSLFGDGFVNMLESDWQRFANY